jgi:hypothetical protein
MRVVCVHRKPNECVVFGNVCVVLVTPDCDMTCTLDQIYVDSGVKKKERSASQETVLSATCVCIVSHSPINIMPHMLILTNNDVLMLIIAHAHHDEA